MTPTFLSTRGELNATMVWQMSFKRVAMILMTRHLVGVAQSVRLTPYAVRNLSLTPTFAGKDFDFSSSTFFADDAPAKSSAPEPRQNAFDRDPLLESRSHVTGEFVPRDSLAFYKLFSPPQRGHLKTY